MRRAPRRIRRNPSLGHSRVMDAPKCLWFKRLLHLKYATHPSVPLVVLPLRRRSFRKPVRVITGNSVKLVRSLTSRERYPLSIHHPVAFGLASCPWLRTLDKKPTGWSGLRAVSLMVLRCEPQLRTNIVLPISPCISQSERPSRHSALLLPRKTDGY
jgi:hypothetical protein